MPRVLKPGTAGLRDMGEFGHSDREDVRCSATLHRKHNDSVRSRWQNDRMGANQEHRACRGFTLIELSIVLIIIGLIVGGVLVGQNLISAASVRAEVTQIEKFNTAANTFFQKYGYLPGDIKDPDASSFGFQARGQYAGEGDGNGLLEGATADSAGNDWCNAAIGTGETTMFWVDLSTAQLIEGSFSTASTHVTNSATITPTSSPSLSAFVPQAKIGSSNYIYVYCGGYYLSAGGPHTGDNRNYFGLSAVASSGAAGVPGRLVSSPGLTVQQAYAIDSKADDGLPQSGRMMAFYLTGSSMLWAAGGGMGGAFNGSGGGLNPTTAAVPGSATTCYDNGSTAGQPQQYSVEISGGANVNCALSFKLQAGD